jgi:hypothetical protein
MTYYTGMSEPRTEARRAEFMGDKATFTQEMFDASEKGDYYFMKRSAGAQRYYVPNPDDPELMLVVTHKHNGYAWEEYDGQGNLVIPVYASGASAESLKFAALRAIEQALYDSPLGKAIGRDGMRPVAQSLAEKFGMDSWDEYVNSDRAFTVKDEDNEGIKTALKELLEWRPEGGYDERLGEIGAECDRVGFAEDADEYGKLLNGASDGFKGKPNKRDKREGAITLMSQPVLYAVAGGKDGGRGIWNRLERLMKVVGLEWEDVR